MKLIYFITVLIFLNFSSFAQGFSNKKCDTCAVLKGKVIDNATKEPIIWVNLLLQGTSDGAATDVNGDFAIYNLAPGKYILKCFKLGYPELKDSISLGTGEIKTVNIGMLDYEEAKAQQAIIDIQKGELKIYWDGWPIFGAPFDEINKIAKKYGFQYVFDGSCDPTAFHWTKYNEIIMNHLDKINGREWRDKIRKEKEELYKKYDKR